MGRKIYAFFNNSLPKYRLKGIALAFPETDMNFSPSLPEFLNDADAYDLIGVQAEFSADTETPLSAYAKLADQKPAFLFESVVGGEQVSRYSFIGFGPRKVISSNLDVTEISETGKDSIQIPTPEDPLSLIEREMQGIRYKPCLKDGRFSGGAVGYLSYEYASRVETTVPVPQKDELGLPLLYFMITDLVLVFDHARQSLTICANVPTNEDPEKAYADACQKILATKDLLSKPSTLSPVSLHSTSDMELSLIHI